MPRALARRRVDAGIVDCVLADERFGVTEYCIGLGHRDILHVPTALTPPHHGHREAMLGTGRSSSRPTCPSRAAEPRSANASRVARASRRSSPTTTSRPSTDSRRFVSAASACPTRCRSSDSTRSRSCSPLIELMSVSHRTRELGRAAAQLRLEHLGGEPAAPGWSSGVRRARIRGGPPARHRCRTARPGSLSIYCRIVVTLIRSARLFTYW